MQEKPWEVFYIAVSDKYDRLALKIFSAMEFLINTLTNRSTDKFSDDHIQHHALVAQYGHGSYGQVKKHLPEMATFDGIQREHHYEPWTDTVETW